MSKKFKSRLILILLLSPFSLIGQPGKYQDINPIILAIYPDYFNDIEKQKWVNYFDEDFKAVISSVDTFNIEPNGEIILVALNWSSIDYIYGEMTEFFVLQIKKNKSALVISGNSENERLYYGGGTQRYDYPTITQFKKLPETGYLFFVEQASYHFASQTYDKMLYVYATNDNKIELAYSTEIESGFDSFSLEDIEIDELFSNIDEYIPQEYLRKNISETKTEYEIIENKDNKTFEKLNFRTSQYYLANKEVVKKVSLQTFIWEGENLVESN